MMTNQEKIRELKEKINECRDYISSDFCQHCTSMYDRIKEYEAQILELQNQELDIDR